MTFLHFIPPFLFFYLVLFDLSKSTFVLQTSIFFYIYMKLSCMTDKIFLLQLKDKGCMDFHEQFGLTCFINTRRKRRAAVNHVIGYTKAIPWKPVSSLESPIKRKILIMQRLLIIILMEVTEYPIPLTLPPRVSKME